MSNPFEENSGPRYGNAYESTPAPTLGGAGSPALPPRNKPPTDTNNSPYGTQRMPSPSNYHQTSLPTSTNAWQESNKTLDEDRNAWSPPPQPQSAYQYTGTAYGNTASTANAYSPTTPNNNNPVSPTLDNTSKIEAPMSVSDNEATYNSKPTGKFSKIRFFIRIALVVAGIGHLGFAAGASPATGEDVPFDSSACFYYLFAVAVLSIIYSAYHVGYYLFRRLGKAEKMKRTILILCDLLFTLLWGIGIIVEIAKFTCKPGQYNKWCDFYNTSIFFGFLSFVLYIVTLGWDAVGGCLNRKKK
ncbi:hypothetical protein BDF21DRAFT_492290 [Thamnidium elegans]|uniref:MARVEL domain-containing protein n=1 Tax=Thamnidium elegans TaxID=101142 RepID=A0A8H7STS4_9FUNG|nr:hypothetical protein INT48_002878 [Thamnidium elegans]KAI8085593.1 hypothetical protein BDF21DRAFT_492290 [Thamnidium elegans]